MEFNSMYGVIKIDNDYPGTVAYIKSIGEDPIYPFMNTNMFGLGEYVLPYYYHNMLITFATTYKGFGLEAAQWNLLILKIENILRNIDFECAQFHVESWMGDYTLYWANKKKLHQSQQRKYRQEEFRLIETAEFFFGFGARGLITAYPDPRYHKNYDELNIENFSYPIKYSSQAFKKVQAFNEKLKDVAIGTVVKYKDVMNEFPGDSVFEIIFVLSLKGIYGIVQPYQLEIMVQKHVELEWSWFI